MSSPSLTLKRVTVPETTRATIDVNLRSIEEACQLCRESLVALAVATPPPRGREECDIGWETHLQDARDIIDDFEDNICRRLLLDLAKDSAPEDIEEED